MKNHTQVMNLTLTEKIMETFFLFSFLTFFMSSPAYAFVNEILSYKGTKQIWVAFFGVLTLLAFVSFLLKIINGSEGNDLWKEGFKVIMAGLCTTQFSLVEGIIRKLF